jgi:hypothetical protein
MRTESLTGHDLPDGTRETAIPGTDVVLATWTSADGLHRWSARDSRGWVENGTEGSPGEANHSAVRSGMSRLSSTMLFDIWNALKTLRDKRETP